ncbi:IS200/IS605 family transposase [Ruminococcus sp. CLA-AA-H200]|uniref:IS200/IS605 family transposase n=1 Tax=Ruminococcus turbiniformis TaxID=2881258 RepID=A0ABS8FX24_9FIRM|nr:IS200/IS605 family transposase [Ruminococcus turbiniformis]MCC2254595.1 IS200/IS605 family transposase [Ruminococcus turbiniformis]
MDRKLIFTENVDVTHGRGYVYLLQYHIVWVTKYRKPVLTGNIAVETKRHLFDTMKSLQMDCLAMEVMPDHIHILASCKPQLRLSDAIKILKGNTARWLFMEHPELKRSLWGGHLWNPSYFVVTVSERSAAQVEAYINSQEGEPHNGSDRNKKR